MSEKPMVEHQTVKLADVLRFYAEAFSMPGGRKLVSHEAWVDPAKGEVMFRLIFIPYERVPK